MKNVQINLGMPEVLVAFSFLIFGMSKWFSIVAFSLAMFGKFATIAMEQHKKDEEEKKINQTFDKLGNVITEVISNAGTKKSSGSFH